jgi:hypothetical protein
MMRAGGAALALLLAAACAELMGPRTAYIRARTGVYADPSAGDAPIAWLRCGQHAAVLGDAPGGLRVRTDGGTEGFIFDRPGIGAFVDLDPAAATPRARLKRRCALVQTRMGLYEENALGRGTRGESVPASAPSVWLECGDVIEIVAVIDPREPTVIRARTRDGAEGSVFHGHGFGEFAAEFSCRD